MLGARGHRRRATPHELAADADDLGLVVARRNHEEEALGALREAESALLRAGLHPVCQMLHGAVEDEIAGYVESRQIDALLMGAYGHGRVRHLVIGSATTDLLRQCDVPVLVFR